MVPEIFHEAVRRLNITSVREPLRRLYRIRPLFVLVRMTYDTSSSNDKEWTCSLAEFTPFRPYAETLDQAWALNLQGQATDLHVREQFHSSLTSINSFPKLSDWAEGVSQPLSHIDRVYREMLAYQAEVFGNFDVEPEAEDSRAGRA